MSTTRQIIVTIAGDLTAIAVCAAISWTIKSLGDPHLPFTLYLHALPLLLAGAVAIYAGLGLYPALGWGAADELKRICQGTTFLFLAAIALTFASKAAYDWSRQVFFVAWLLSLAAVPLTRSVVRRACCNFAWWSIPCAILGAGATGDQVVKLLTSRPWLGLKPVLVLDDDPLKHGAHPANLVISGPVRDHIAHLHETGIHHAVLAMPGMPTQQLSTMLDALGEHVRHVFIAPAMPGSPDVIATTREFANTLVLEMRQELLRPQARLLKRATDLALASAGLLLFGWLFCLLMLLIRLTSTGPIFYGQTRIGQGRKSFKAWKFRSMVQGADALLANYLATHPELREEWESTRKLKSDPRVTSIGRFLRRTSLDELPQLWNVLCGEMSLAGPRPIVNDEIERYGNRFALYCKVRPGLSGLWQVSGRSDTGYAERVALDCYYVRNWSLWLDAIILARTIRVVLLGKGAY